MKIGVFANINCDSIRLRRTLDEIIEKVDDVYCLGNVMGPLEQKEPYTISENNLVCLDILQKYKKQLKSDNKYFGILAGKNEIGFLRREYSEGRASSDLYKRIQLLFNSEVSMFSTQYRNQFYVFLSQTSDEDLNFEMYNNLIKSIVEKAIVIRKNTGVCFIGDGKKQGIYILERRLIKPIPVKEIFMEPKKLYIVSPSSQSNGHCIFDEESINLF